MVRLSTLSSLAGLALAAGSAQAASKYSLVDNYDVDNFFDEFEFFTGQDPTNGFVQYTDQQTAKTNGLIGSKDGAVYMGVDSTNTTTTGRQSVRVTSKKAYTKGLFIADIAHMPSGKLDAPACGLWPAFWMFGPNWPHSGEIDIIEGVNSATSNSMSLHTGPGCEVHNLGAVAGTKLAGTNCTGNSGCTQKSAATDNFGFCSQQHLFGFGYNHGASSILRSRTEICILPSSSVLYT